MTYIYIYISQAQLEHFLKNLQYLREAHKNLSDCGKDTAVLWFVYYIIICLLKVYYHYIYIYSK